MDEVPGQGLSGVTVAFTKLHAGGKFDSGAYKVSGGLHGVGASVVNALSETCEVEVYQRGKIHFQRFERGKAVTKLEVRGKTDKRGTKVYFKPDPKIFQVSRYDAGTIGSRLRELAFLNKGLVDPADRRALGSSQGGDVPLRGRHPGVRQLAERGQGGPPQGRHLLRSDHRRHRDRGGVPVQQRLPRRRADLRQQHPHGRGRDASLRLPHGAHQAAGGVRPAREVLHPRREADGRQLPRGPDRGRQREGPRAPVRGADQDQARQQRGRGRGGQRHRRRARELPRGEPAHVEADPREGGAFLPGLRGREEGEGPHPAQGGAGERQSPGQARRLPEQGPRLDGALHRRGRVGRRHGQGRSRPRHAGDPPAARQDPERREGAAGQDARPRGDPHAHHRDRDRHRRGRRGRRGRLRPRPSCATARSSS